MAWIDLLNRLLPFATKGTPLLQDLVHLAAICVLLYFAPQIQERLQGSPSSEPEEEDNPQPLPHPAPERINNDINNNNPPQPAPHHAPPPPPNPAAHAPPPHHAHADSDSDSDNENNNNNRAPHAAAPAAGAPSNRAVGAKKAKSLARRDQRRAYNEFLRTQGDAQRAADAAGNAERESAQQAERARRQAAAAAVEARKTQEREERRRREEQAREEERGRREGAVRMVRAAVRERRRCHVFDVVSAVGGEVDEGWVEKILAAAGVLGRDAEGGLTMITSAGWVVRVTREDMDIVYKRVREDDVGDEKGRVGVEVLGRLLDETLFGKA